MEYNLCGLTQQEKRFFFFFFKFQKDTLEHDGTEVTITTSAPQKHLVMSLIRT